MSVTNDFVPFCYQDTGTNLEEQADYLVDPQRTIGNQPGIASSQLVNKALRQATAVASNFAQYIANFLNNNTIDNGNEAQLLSQFQAGLQPLAPTLTQLLSGTGTWNPTVYFFCASANATAGATYTNNSITYTVVSTISGAILLQTTGSGAPTANGGTLTKSSGTGDSTITFYAYRLALYLKVKMVGGGGGGGGGGQPSGGSGSGGTATTFGSQLVADGGGGGAFAEGGVPGGGTTLGSVTTGIAITGSYGQCGSAFNNQPSSGGSGGCSPFGGNGAGYLGAGSGTAAAPNSGSGGGGGGAANAPDVSGNGGGAAGGYVEAILPAQSYTYSVGAQGSGGSAGSSGGAGANGGTGLILITEEFQ